MSTKKTTARNVKKAPTKPKGKEKKQRLTDKQRLFLSYYLVSLNGTEAALKAYDTEDRVVAANIASENLRKPYIREAIDEELRRRTMTAAEVLARLTEHATVSMEDFITINEDKPNPANPLAQSVISVLNLPKAKQRGKLHLIKELTETRTFPKEGGMKVEVTLKLHDAQAALRDMGRYHKLFVDRTEVTGKDGGPIPIEDARAALAQRLADRLKRTGSGSGNPEPQPAGG